MLPAALGPPGLGLSLVVESGAAHAPPPSPRCSLLPPVTDGMNGDHRDSLLCARSVMSACTGSVSPTARERQSHSRLTQERRKQRGQVSGCGPTAHDAAALGAGLPSPSSQAPTPWEGHAIRGRLSVGSHSDGPPSPAASDPCTRLRAHSTGQPGPGAQKPRKPLCPPEPSPPGPGVKNLDSGPGPASCGLPSARGSPPALPSESRELDTPPSQRHRQASPKAGTAAQRSFRSSEALRGWGPGLSAASCCHCECWERGWVGGGGFSLSGAPVHFTLANGSWLPKAPRNANRV